MKSVLPKPLHHVGGRPMLAWAIDAAKASGADRIVTVLSRESTSTQEWLGQQEFAIQHPPLGTGHAVLAARETLANFEGVGLVMFADTPLVTSQTLVALAAQIATGQDIVILGFETPQPTGYGRIILDADGMVQQIVEDRDTNSEEAAITLVNGGIMAARIPLLFDLLDSVDISNAQNEIYLTDVVSVGRSCGCSIACEVTNGDELMGVNTRSDLARAEALLQAQLRIAAMASGVTLRAPDTVFLSAESVIERDVIIEPHVVIGTGCHIGEGSVIKAFSHIEGARLGKCCVIGPYARLRPGTNAADGVKIGNFVETKDVSLGDGAKASHLSYLGDAEVGAAANIGAGTITCNYDGFNKYRTIVGRSAFIGSNTALVAPIAIGDGAIVGAGSTMSDDVGANDIAFTRADVETRKQAAPAFRDRKKAIKEGRKGKQK